MFAAEEKTLQQTKADNFLKIFKKFFENFQVEIFRIIKFTALSDHSVFGYFRYFDINFTNGLHIYGY